MIDPNTEPEAGTVETKIVAALRRIFDPELPVNIYDLGLIYEIKVSADGAARVVMTLTAPNCPVAGSLPGEVERAVAGVEGVRSATVELTWSPKWTAARLSDAARLELEFTGHTGPIGGPMAVPRSTGLTVGRRPVRDEDDPR